MADETGQLNPSALTLVWDVDDVLNDLMRAWFEQAWQKEQPCRLDYSELLENPPHRLLGCDIRRYLESLDRFRESEAFERLPPQPDITRWFERHGARFHHVALTAVPIHVSHRSAAWTLKRFGRWLRTFHVIPSPRSGVAAPAFDADKTAYLRRLDKVALFIDDNEDNINSARSAGFLTLLFPRPWNSARAGSIAEVVARLDQLAADQPEAKTTGKGQTGE